MHQLGPTGDANSAIAFHGFTASGRSFGALSTHLSRAVVAPDLPGHGGSPAAKDVTETIALLAKTLASTRAPRLLIGYSMGGRLALQVALGHPELVDELVLISTGSGITDPSERCQRRLADDALADRFEQMTIETLIDYWLSRPIVALPASVPVHIREDDRRLRLRNDPVRLAGALRLLGQGVQPAMSHRLSQLAIPTLLISGGADERYTETMAAMARVIQRSTHVVIPGAPHNVVTATPKEVANAISSWVAAIER